MGKFCAQKVTDHEYKIFCVHHFMFCVHQIMQPKCFSVYDTINIIHIFKFKTTIFPQNNFPIVHFRITPPDVTISFV